MAKRKRKNKKLLELLDLVILLTGLAATVMFMFKAFEVETVKLTLEGFKLAFGDKDYNLDFNFLNAAAILLPGVVGVLAFILKNKMLSVVTLVGVIIHVILILTLKIEIIGNFSLSIKLLTLGYIALALAVVEGLVAGIRFYLSN